MPAEEVRAARGSGPARWGFSDRDHAAAARLERWKQRAGRVLDVIFPPRCASCGDFGALLCAPCRRRLEPLGADRCPRCGRPGVAISRDGWCADCVDRQLEFTSARSAFLYTGVARRVISALKYGGERGLAEIMAEEAFPAFWALAAEVPSPMVTWVPSHASTRSARGFNQAKLFAGALVARSGGRLQACELVRKIRATPHQQTLSREERRRNLACSFAVVARPALGKPGLSLAGLTRAASIVVVDDVYTTGATASEVAGVAAGGWGLPVHVFTFARAMHPASDFRD